MQAELLEPLSEGERVRIKEGFHPQVILRDWKFQGAEKGEILLKNTGGYIFKVRAMEIDWEEYRRRRK